MPEKKTLERARASKKAGKAPSTQAGEFVKEEIDHIREGKHGARSTKQAIAIGLSKARRAGVELKPPKAGQSSPATRKKAQKDLEAGRRKPAAKKTSAKQSQARKRVLKGESRAVASHSALSRQAKSAAKHSATRSGAPSKRTRSGSTSKAAKKTAGKK